MSRIIIGVMGPGENATPTEEQHAFAVGQQIAQQGWVLLTGGRRAGVMEAASRGAKQMGGLTIGILPTAEQPSPCSPYIDIPILTGLGNARNAVNVLSSHVVIACGMGSGTASEVALALKANRPVILLAVDETSRRFFQQLAPDRTFIATSAEAAIQLTHPLLVSILG